MIWGRSGEMCMEGGELGGNPLLCVLLPACCVRVCVLGTGAGCWVLGVVLGAVIVMVARG